MNNLFLHRFRKHLRCVTTILAVSMLSLAMILPAAAAETAPTGTLTIRPKYGDKVLTASEYDGTFKIYHIADYAETGTFTKDAALGDLEVTIDGPTLSDDETYKQLTQTIAAYVKNHSADIKPFHTAIKVDETLTLPYGLYLITSDQLAKGYKDFESFLVMLPEYGENSVNTNVTAYPKVSPEPEEPEEPHEPHEPGTPGTPPTPPVPEIEEPGEITETPEIEEIGGYTGDESHMALYGAIVVIAAAGLVLWIVMRRRANHK